MREKNENFVVSVFVFKQKTNKQTNKNETKISTSCLGQWDMFKCWCEQKRNTVMKILTKAFFKCF